jgi:hypothetical protein
MVYVTLKEVEEVEGSSRHFRRPFSLVRFFLDEQKEMNINKKKKVSFLDTLNRLCFLTITHLCALRS